MGINTAVYVTACHLTTVYVCTCVCFYTSHTHLPLDRTFFFSKNGFTFHVLTSPVKRISCVSGSFLIIVFVKFFLQLGGILVHVVFSTCFCFFPSPNYELHVNRSIFDEHPQAHWIMRTHKRG